MKLTSCGVRCRRTYISIKLLSYLTECSFPVDLLTPQWFYFVTLLSCWLLPATICKKIFTISECIPTKFTMIFNCAKIKMVKHYLSRLAKALVRSWWSKSEFFRVRGMHVYCLWKSRLRHLKISLWKLRPSREENLDVSHAARIRRGWKEVRTTYFWMIFKALQYWDILRGIVWNFASRKTWFW
jgi:hypothetical protein